MRSAAFLALLGLAFLGAALPESPVADAAMRGDVVEVRALLARGAEVDAAQGDGMTGLHWAADRGDAELTAVLLAAGAHTTAVTRLAAYTPVHLAARSGHAGVVDALLTAGADPAAVTTSGQATALHFAAAAGSAPAVGSLVKAGADPNARETSWGQTPLMFAAAAGRVAAVRALLAEGAEPWLTARVIDMEKRDAADQADQSRRNRRIEAQRAGVPFAEVPEGPTSQNVNEAQRDRVAQPISRAKRLGPYGGLSALLMAVRDGHAEVAAALLQGGANVDQPSAGDRTTPLLMASINGHFDLAMRLLEAGADANASSVAGATPLYVTVNAQWIPRSRHPQPAARLQQSVTYLELMSALLEAGADPNRRLEMSLWFTTFGDDYLGVDRMGATPFWRAAYALDIDAMKLLLAHGADPNIPTLKPAGRSRGRPVGPDESGLPPVPVGGPGVWPIHAASGVGYGEGFAANIHEHVPEGWLPSVRFLVEEVGVDVNARDFKGFNAIHHAAARGDDELIMYLVGEGVDVTAVARSGQTTADMANGPVQRISPFLGTVALLESLGSKNNHRCVGC